MIQALSTRKRGAASFAVTPAACVVTSALMVAAATAAGPTSPPANYGEAMAWYEQQAAAGNPETQHYLGQLYEHGVRAPPADPADASTPLGPSDPVDPANPLGPLNPLVPLNLLAPTEPPSRYRLAAAWYREAALQGHLRAQERLAALLYRGAEGVRARHRRGDPLVRPRR